MKKLLIIFSLFFFCSSAFADIIVTTSNQRIVCKIVKSDNKYVYYQINGSGTQKIHNDYIVSISISESSIDSSTTDSSKSTMANPSNNNSKNIVGDYSGPWSLQDFYYFAYLQHNGLIDPYFYRDLTREEKDLITKIQSLSNPKEFKQLSQGHSQQAESAVRKKDTSTPKGDETEVGTSTTSSNKANKDVYPENTINKKLYKLEQKPLKSTVNGIDVNTVSVTMANLYYIAFLKAVNCFNEKFELGKGTEEQIKLLRDQYFTDELRALGKNHDSSVEVYIKRDSDK